MSMYVAKMTEDRKNKKVWEGDPEKLVRSINKLNGGQYPLLSGIALYEDTYFNSQQITGLVDEIKMFADELKQMADRKDLESLVKFAESVQLQEHLVFVGD